MGARAKAVRLSQATAEKQGARHPELSPADYRRIQRMLDEGEVVRQGRRHLVATLRDGDRWYQVVVKVTKDRRGLFIVSYRRARSEQSAVARRRGNVVKRAR